MTISPHLVAIVGSLRENSFNRSVFNAAVELVTPDVGLVEVSVNDIPLYDGDVESTGDPAAVEQLKLGVNSAAALIIFTPEYNRGVPAVTKNAIDWLSRLPGKSVLTRTTVGIVAATPGRHDAKGVRTHLSDSMLANTQKLYPETLGIGSIGHKITDGRLDDPEAREQLAQWLFGFVKFVKGQRND